MDWIVVAHRAGARLYKRRPFQARLELIREIENPEGRLKARDIKSDRPGRYFSPADVSRHGVSAPASPQDQLAEHFAREIAGVLEEGRTQNSYDDLVLIADPRMLGMVKGALTRPTASKVADVLNKDYARFDDHTLQLELSDYLRGLDKYRALRKTA